MLGFARSPGLRGYARPIFFFPCRGEKSIASTWRCPKRQTAGYYNNNQNSRRNEPNTLKGSPAGIRSRVQVCPDL